MNKRKILQLLGAPSPSDLSGRHSCYWRNVLLILLCYTAYSSSAQDFKLNREGGDLIVSWQGRGDQGYSVHSSQDLLNWEPVHELTGLPGTGAQIRWRDPSYSSEPAKFYKLTNYPKEDMPIFQYQLPELLTILTSDVDGGLAFPIAETPGEGQITHTAYANTKPLTVSENKLLLPVDFGRDDSLITVSIIATSESGASSRQLVTLDAIDNSLAPLCGVSLSGPMPQVLDENERGLYRAALVGSTSRLWDKQEIRVSFVSDSKDGFNDFVWKGPLPWEGDSPSRRITDVIIEIAQEWTEFANIDFVFVDNGNKEADIRIKIDPKDKTAWSAIGNDALWKTGPTMNLPFTALTPLYDVRRKTLHEFGHALGFRHEHKSPVSGISWNKKAVYKSYIKQKEENCKCLLSPEEVKEAKNEAHHNVLDNVPASQTRFSKYDEKSVMLYPIKVAWTTDGYSTDLNTRLSDVDQIYASILYPGRSRGLWSLTKGKYWFLKGQRSMLYDHQAKKAIWNMQMDNTKGFPGAWTDVDAGCSAGDGRYWLFKGQRCMLYDHRIKKVIWNMQMDNTKGFPGAWTDLDAATIDGDNNFWFFKDGRCMLYDYPDKRVIWNMQMDNTKGFPGAWTDLDAATIDGDNNFWFFKGGRCMLYDYPDKRVIWNMQMDNTKGFPGAWTNLDAALFSPL